VDLFEAIKRRRSVRAFARQAVKAENGAGARGGKLARWGTEPAIMAVSSSFERLEGESRYIQSTSYATEARW
jgi:hypothetical protein